MKPGRAQQSRRAPLGALLWRRICADAHVFFRRQVGQKEKELHDMNEYRIHTLECSVAERDRQVLRLLARTSPIQIKASEHAPPRVCSACPCAAATHCALCQTAELRAALRALKTDFEFNLKLIEERDAELERADGALAALNGALREREAELSDLNVSLDEAEAQLRAEQVAAVPGALARAGLQCVCNGAPHLWAAAAPPPFLPPSY